MDGQSYQARLFRGLMAAKVGPVEDDETACCSDRTPIEETQCHGSHIVCQEQTPHEPVLLKVDRTTSCHKECGAECDYMSTEKGDGYVGLLKEFWEDIKESPYYCPHWRSWEHFHSALKLKFPKVTHATMEALKLLLSEEITENGLGTTRMVKLENLLKLTKCFGPFVDIGEGSSQCFTLCKLAELLKESSTKKDKTKISWFAGNMSRQEADTRLKDKEEGTFLIRLSQTIFGAFVLSVKPGSEEAPIHIDFQFEEDTSDRNRSNALCIRFRGYTKKPFCTVHQLVSEFKQEYFDSDFCDLLLSKPCPDLPFNTIVTGYKGRR